MQKQEAQNIIESTFNASFSEEKFTLFIKNLLNDIDTTKYNEYHGQYIKDAFKEHIKQYKRIGKYTDPNGDALDVLIVEVKDQTKLDKTRTALRNFVISHLDSFEKDYALVAFYSNSDHGADWRFSFVKLEYKTEVKEGKLKQSKELTPAKRYSFLVGEHEKAHTAKKQLLPLLENVYNNPTLEELEEAFSIEKVTDEFFEQYKALFLGLTEQFNKEQNDPIASIGLKEQLAAAGIDIPRFTKKLLGQIVFLYFLQKKGWLGVPKTEKWGKGEKKYLQKLFDEAQKNGKNFFGDYLQPLFYKALAHKHADEGIKGYYKTLGCKVPFLNGGLFEADYKWEESHITIPNHFFRNMDKVNKTGDVGTGVLDVFDRYNFTIKEDEPLEKEVAVDPEMLGKVFENMLEVSERKSKGAFYTPREIVHYMCQESLIHYLDNAVNTYAKTYQELGDAQTNLFGNAGKTGQQSLMQEQDQVIVPKEDIQVFIRKGFFALENDLRVLKEGKETRTYTYKLPESIRLKADLLDEKLANIKICDPAIGSGAFPVGMLHEIVNARLVLRQYLKNQKNNQGNQTNPTNHGSDNYLDNYAYQLKRHTIQESIYGVDIDASAIDIARLRLWLSLVVDEEDLDNIEALPNLDYKIVFGNSLIGLPENAMRNLEVEKELETLKEEFFAETDETRKKELRTKINTKIRQLLDTAEEFAGYKIDFDFKLFFSEVWHQKNGFDVVIGNPPYYQIQKLSKTQIQKDYQSQSYETFSKTGDIYELFYEKGYRLLKPNGALIYITSNKWMRTAYGKSTREFFSKKTNPLLVLDFGNVQNFATATVDTNILLIEKRVNQLKTIGSRIDNDFHPNTHSINDYIQSRTAHFEFATSDEWVIVDPGLLKIKRKVEMQGIPLSKWKIEINYGIKTGFNEAFFLNEKTKSEIIKKDPKSSNLIHPLLRGKDIKKWHPKSNSLSIIGTFPSLKINISDYPGIKSHLDSFGRKRLEQSGESGSRKKTTNKWFETQDSISYWKAFCDKKIIYPNMSKYLPFVYDTTEHFYSNDKSFIITGTHIEYLCCFLNSTLFKGIYSDNFPELQGGTRELRKVFMEKISVKKVDESLNSTFKIPLEYLVFLSKSTDNNLFLSYFENIVDALIFELYFPIEIKSAGKEILKHLGDLPTGQAGLKPISDSMSEEEKLAIIQSEFERLYDPNHPVRNNVETLDSVEEVRIIKEALK